MRPMLCAILVALFVVMGCVVSTGPAVSKSSMGNLEINVSARENMSYSAALIYVDDVPVGNVSPTKPVLHLKRGDRAIRVELEGCKPYKQQIRILGDPNQQVLNVVLEKE